ncbi:hypothetical protein LCGC14_1728380 [marine sediment metagenome]|uniref:Uncharacterized protein n=1 Tax=marine sediment metagenome TaxID=412755 RepID=A0A0F9KA03_9ZZZZ
MEMRSGKPAKLFTDASVSGSWTALTEKDNTDSQPGIEITAVLFASGSWTTDKLASGSYGGIREDYPAYREAGQNVGLNGSGYYVSSVSGSYLQLRDADNDVIYERHSTGTSPIEGGAVVDLLQTPIVAQLPIQYWCANGTGADPGGGGGCIIRIWGNYK